MCWGRGRKWTEFWIRVEGVSAAKGLRHGEGAVRPQHVREKLMIKVISNFVCFRELPE